MFLFCITNLFFSNLYLFDFCKLHIFPLFCNCAHLKMLNLRSFENRCSEFNSCKKMFLFFIKNLFLQIYICGFFVNYVFFRYFCICDHLETQSLRYFENRSSELISCNKMILFSTHVYFCKFRFVDLHI